MAPCYAFSSQALEAIDVNVAPEADLAVQWQDSHGMMLAHTLGTVARTSERKEGAYVSAP